MASTSTYDLIVIGAGPGGYVASIRAAQLGLKVACVEKRDTLGGTCLNVGCIPSKALLQSSENFEAARDHFAEHGVISSEVRLDLKQMMKRKQGIVDGLTKGIEGLFAKNKIEWLHGGATFTSSDEIEVDGKRYRAKHIIIATGSEPTPLPFLPFDEKQVLSSTGALKLNKVPKHMIVIGGGVIGLELGSVYRRLGSEVTVVEFMDHILPGMDEDICKEMLKIMKRQGMKFHLSARVNEAKVMKTQTRINALSANGEALELSGDAVLVAIGRRPYLAGLGLEAVGVKVVKGRVEIDRQFKTNVKGIYAIGDVVDGPMLAHKAEEEGVACAEIIAGHQGHVDYMDIPGIVYTSPEVATVGITEAECREAGIPYRKGTFPLKANSRARCMGNDQGLVKILSHEQTDRILGIHIIAAGASELIAEAVVAMAFKASAEDIAMICHGHPTLSEAVREAALGLHQRAIHI